MKRGNLKPGPQTPSYTDESFADRYIEDLRYPKWIPIKVRFPYVEDRRAANIDYKSEEWHRSFRGRVPFEAHPYDALKVQPPKDFASSQYLFTSNVTQGRHVPEGYCATESGIAPISGIPFQGCPPSDHPNVIDGKDDNVLQVSEFFVANNTPYSGYSNPYIYINEPGIGRFNWDLAPGYSAPTYPELRYPNGAVRRKNYR